MKRCTNRYGLYIRAARKRAGMSQKDMANYLGNSQSWLSKIESGVLIPSVTEFLKVRRIVCRIRKTA